MPSRLPFVALLLAAATGGCAPSLATMEPARTTPAGHFEMGTSVEVAETSGSIRETLDEVREMGGGDISRSDLRTVADATSAALVQPPSLGYQVQLSYGLSRRFEVGLRTSMSAVRGWGRWQFLREAPGWYGAVGVGVTGHLYGFPVGTFVNEIEVDEHSRYDFDIPLHFGFSHRVFHAWAGPKVVLSTYDAAFRVCMDGDGCRREASVELAGTAGYLGGQIGLAVGYERVWVAAELTVAHLGTEGDLDVEMGSRNDAHAFDHEGVVLSPAFGVLLWF